MAQAVNEFQIVEDLEAALQQMLQLQPF